MRARNTRIGGLPARPGTVSPGRGRISPSQRRIPRPVAASDSLQLRAAILTRPPRFSSSRPPCPSPSVRAPPGSSPPPFSPSSPAPPRPRVPRRRHAGRDRRGDHRVHARQRPEGAAVSRRDQADDDRQRHLSRRLAPGELRRDRAWRTCSSTCCSRARRRSRASSRSSAAAACASTARRSSTAPTISRRSPPPTRTSTGRSRWKPTGW